MTFLNEMSAFMKSDFKLHPSCFLDNDSDEHTTLDQRKENQRVSKALRRLFPIFDIIWASQSELQIQLQQTDSLEKSVFNEHGLKQYYIEAGKVDKLQKEFVKLIKKYSNEPIIKEYYLQFEKYSVDLFPTVFSGSIENVIKLRTQNEVVVDQQEAIQLFKGNAK